MHSAPEPFRPWRRWAFAALALAVAVRVLLLADKPFWRDEVWVAQLVEAPLDTLFAVPRPVPVGFVAITKLAATLPLAPEISYRLLPLVAGVALVPLLAALAAALGAAPPVPLVVMWLAAGMPALVYYSRELKPYGFDALLATLVPLLTLHLFARAAGRQRAPAAAGAGLTAVLAVAPWLAFGAQFAIAATLAWGWLAWWRNAAPSARRWWGLASAAYAASFALVFRLALGAQAASPRLHTYWRGALLQEVSPSLLTQAGAALERYASIAATYFFPGVWPVVVPLLAIGALVWPRRWRAFAVWLCLVTTAAAIGAALADRYLITAAAGRLLLFATPPLLLFAAAGLSSLARRLSPARGGTLAVVLSAALAVVWSGLALAHRLPPYRNDIEAYFLFDILHDVPALLDAAGGVIAPGEPLYIARCASRPFAYYARGRFADATVCREPCDLLDTAATWLENLHGRGWMMVVADERDRVADLPPHSGATFTPRVTARGAELWEVQR
jgi:hypothetical protein